MSFAGAKANTNLPCALSNWSIRLLGTVELWQTNERLICNELNGMNDFGIALLVQLVDGANAHMLIQFEFILVKHMPW